MINTDIISLISEYLNSIKDVIYLSQINKTVHLDKHKYCIHKGYCCSELQGYHIKSIINIINFNEEQLSFLNNNDTIEKIRCKINRESQNIINIPKNITELQIELTDSDIYLQIPEHIEYLFIETGSKICTIDISNCHNLNILYIRDPQNVTYISGDAKAERFILSTHDPEILKNIKFLNEVDEIQYRKFGGTDEKIFIPKYDNLNRLILDWEPEYTQEGILDLTEIGNISQLDINFKYWNNIDINIQDYHMYDEFYNQHMTYIICPANIKIFSLNVRNYSPLIPFIVKDIPINMDTLIFDLEKDINLEFDKDNHNHNSSDIYKINEVDYFEINGKQPILKIDSIIDFYAINCDVDLNLYNKIESAELLNCTVKCESSNTIIGELLFRNCNIVSLNCQINNICNEQ